MQPDPAAALLAPSTQADPTQAAWARIDALEAEVAHLARSQQNVAQATVTGYPASFDVEAPPQAAPTAEVAPPLEQPCAWLCVSTVCAALFSAFLWFCYVVFYLTRIITCNTPAAATVASVAPAVPALPDWPQCTAHVTFQSHDGATHGATILLLARECGASLVGTLTPVCYRWGLPSQLIAGDCPPGTVSIDEAWNMAGIFGVILLFIGAANILMAVTLVRKYDTQCKLWIEEQIRQAVEQPALGEVGEPASECTSLLQDRRAD